METARVDDATFEFEITGTGEPVVFIHGVFIADTFRPLLAEPELAEHYQLIHYHRRGYAGSSGPGEDRSIARQAADCLGLLRRLGVDRAHVVGHSYGGAIALQLALDAPDSVQTLTLLEPALAAGDSAPDYRDSLLRSIERYRAVGPRVVVDEFLEIRCPGYRELLDRRLPDAFSQAVADATTTFEHEIPGLLEWRFTEAEARRISQPVLSMLGGNSDALSPRFGEAHRLLLEWLPLAEGVVISETTHFMQLEAPDRIAEAISGFLTRHSLSPPSATTGLFDNVVL